jgi:DNA mismatch endonuclease, patch repair protein
MVDVFSNAKRSDVMSRIRSSRNASTELLLQSEFRQNGITGWRTGSKLRGRPDFVFPKHRVAVFVDGCFWHGCKRCMDGHQPKSNSSYWVEKIKRNQRRDRIVNRLLRETGFSVWRIPECGLKSGGANVTRLLNRLQPGTQQES